MSLGCNARRLPLVVVFHRPCDAYCMTTDTNRGQPHLLQPPRQRLDTMGNYIITTSHPTTFYHQCDQEHWTDEDSMAADSPTQVAASSLGKRRRSNRELTCDTHFQSQPAKPARKPASRQHHVPSNNRPLKRSDGIDVELNLLLGQIDTFRLLATEQYRQQQQRQQQIQAEAMQCC